MKRTLFLALILAFCTPQVEAHLPTQKCLPFELPGKAAKLSDGEQWANGLYAEPYDLDGDGKADVVTLSYGDGQQHNPHPVFFLLDTDKDGDPDAVYIDKVGEGRCVDIVLYEDLLIPHDRGVMTKWSETAADQGRQI